MKNKENLKSTFLDFLIFFKNKISKTLKNKENGKNEILKNTKNEIYNFFIFLKMYKNVNCRKSNKKFFLVDSLYINELKKFPKNV